MDAGVSISDSGCERRYSRQRMQESLYQTVDAVFLYQTRMQETISDSRCRSMYIRQRMQETL